jgi:hypothetical protein
MQSVTSPKYPSVQPLALGLALLACLLAAMLRIFPLEWNFAPVGALALFAGARVRGWPAYALPLVLLVCTDAVLAQLRGYPFLYAGTPFVYGSFLLNVLLGRALMRTENPALLGATALGASVQFFVITNFGVWLTSALVFPGGVHSYPATLGGLLDCFVLAVPFYRGTLAGDLLFSALLFGAHAWLTRLHFHTERVGLALPLQGDGPTPSRDLP